MLLTSAAKTRLVVGGLEDDAQRLVLPLSPTCSTFPGAWDTVHVAYMA